MKIETPLIEIHQHMIKPWTNDALIIRCAHCNHLLVSESEVIFGYRFRIGNGSGWYDMMSWTPGSYSDGGSVYCKECTINSMSYILMTASTYIECMELEASQERYREIIEETENTPEHRKGDFDNEFFRQVTSHERLHSSTNWEDSLENTLRSFYRVIVGSTTKWCTALSNTLILPGANGRSDTEDYYHWLQVICFTTFIVIDTLEHNEHTLKQSLEGLYEFWDDERTTKILGR